MKFSTLPTAACFGKKFTSVFYRLFLLSALVAIQATAQTSVTPLTGTVQFGGTPNISSPVTAPAGGLVMYGTAISSVTGQPVRHLWVADGSAGICRMDPDLDSAGPYAINPATCPFNTAAKGSILGGTMTLDPVNRLLYFVDNQRVSQGIFRVSYLSGGSGGHGALDMTTLFNLAGGPAGTIYAGGQTGCALPGTQLFPNAPALDPSGNLWVGFGKASLILKFSNPAAATSANFGGCAQFVQNVATVPNNKNGTGLAWIGHNLWGASSSSVFVIPGADSTCLIGSNPACSTTNGTIRIVAPAISGANSVAGDQFYPAVNGNNLYFGLASDVAWLGNASGAAASQTLALTYTNSAANPLANVGAVVLDGTDPANLVLYSADDPSALATPGAGRWFQTTQTAAAPAPPDAPLNVIATGGGNQSAAAVTWSPAQTGQLVTGYTVYNDFASNGITLPDVAVTPAGGSPYPPTSTAISGLAPNVAYTFQVAAANSQGRSPHSASSNLIPQSVIIPLQPTGVSAIAGDAQARVSWTAPPNTNGAIITSYTVTALIDGAPSGVSSTIAAPSSAGLNTILSGLTNGTAYTFTVHASSLGGDGPESAPSAAVTPLLTNVPVMRILVTGPVSQNPVPAIVTYQVTVTNTSLFPVTNVIVNNVLTSTDSAFIIVGEPHQGTCTPGGPGVTTVACLLGDMAPGAVATIDVATQMQLSQITLTSRVTANDQNGSSTTFKTEHRSTSPPGNSPPPDAAQISIPVTGGAVPTTLNPLQSGVLTWTVQNNTGVQANSVLLTLNIEKVLSIDSVIASPAGGSNPVICDPPVPGLINTNVVICSIASLGGPKAANPVTSFKITVNVTAPNLPNLQLLPSGTISFDGIDTSNPTATIKLRVH